MNTVRECEPKRSHRNVASSRDELFAADEQRDIAFCGVSLSEPRQTRLADQGAHDPTPTPYFILEDLFGKLAFNESSHLLDVGCGTGRALAYFAEARFPGRATGVELDPELATYAAAWVRRFDNLDVICENALNIPLGTYTHLYLFNPFDTNVLLQFLAAIEEQAAHPITLVHQSDNGETYFYSARPGWSLLHEGEFQKHAAPNGRMFTVFEHPQHYSIWRYNPL